MPAWIPLIEYAARKGVSMSTLRRRIKANKIEHRLEGGRYLVLDSDDDGSTPVSGKATGAKAGMGTGAEVDRELHVKFKKLESELYRAQEEIAELKMLVALYEDKMSFGHRDN